MKMKNPVRKIILSLVGVMFIFIAGYLTHSFLSEKELPDELVIVENEGKAEAEAQQPSTEQVVQEEQEEIVIEPVEEIRVVEQGDSFSKILMEWLSNDEVYVLAEDCKKFFTPSKIKIGEEYKVVTYSGVLIGFEYMIDQHNKLIISRAGESEAFTVSIEKIIYDIRLEMVSGDINSSLFMTMSDLGESASLALKIAEIYAWEINFIKDIQPGDSFNVLVEKMYTGENFKGYGKLLAAEFINQGKKYEAFYFEDKNGIVEYYTDKGESVKRAFLKAPLAYNRISSGYTNRRLHPIYKTWKAHPAIDYAAPTGTPVKAIGNGVVVFVGSDQHAGKYVKLQHPNGYESMYLHLSRFHTGLKKGVKVRQGQVIAYVGATGDATGPHLDFRMKKNGQFINPAQHTAPRAEPIKGAELERFNVQRDECRLFLDKSKDLAEYQPNEGKI